MGVKFTKGAGCGSFTYVSRSLSTFLPRYFSACCQQFDAAKKLQLSGARTLFILIPHFLEIDFSAEASPDHAQASTPRNGICDGIILVEVVLSESRIYAFIREDGICHLVLLVARAYSGRDALLHCPPLSLYTQNFRASRNAYCAFIAGGALCEMH